MSQFRNLLGLPVKGFADRQDGQVLVPMGDHWEFADQSGGGSWGEIDGTLADQIDLQAALDAKQDLGSSVTLSGYPDDYASLPSGLGSGDAGKAYMLQSDGLVYIWDGSAWPADGAGVRLSSTAWTVVAHYDHATDGDDPGPIIADVRGYTECRVQVMFLAITSSGYRYAQVSFDGGATYKTKGYYAIDTNGTYNNYNNFGLHSSASAGGRSGFVQFGLVPVPPSTDIWGIDTRADVAVVVPGVTSPITHVMADWPGSATGGRCTILAR